MKKLSLVLSLFLGLALASPAWAQTALTQTRLTAAVNSSSTTLVVASATGISAGSTYLYVDQELLFVNAVNSTTLTVQRGASGTVAKGHILAATVLLGPAPAFVYTNPSGSCNNGSGLFLYSPLVNLNTGQQWLCSSITGQVVPGFRNGPPQQSSVTTAVASVAGATLPSGPLFHVTGTNAITAWGSSTTVGAVGMGGSTNDAQGGAFCVIPDAAYTTTATNNIAVASTGVVNKIQCWSFDATNKKYVPSY